MSAYQDMIAKQAHQKFLKLRKRARKRGLVYPKTRSASKINEGTPPATKARSRQSGYMMGGKSGASIKLLKKGENLENLLD